MKYTLWVIWQLAGFALSWAAASLLAMNFERIMEPPSNSGMQTTNDLQVKATVVSHVTITLIILLLILIVALIVAHIAEMLWGTWIKKQPPSVVDSFKSLWIEIRMLFLLVPVIAVGVAYFIEELLLTIVSPFQPGVITVVSLIALFAGFLMTRPLILVILNALWSAVCQLPRINWRQLKNYKIQVRLINKADHKKYEN